MKLYEKMALLVKEGKTSLEDIKQLREEYHENNN